MPVFTGSCFVRSGEHRSATTLAQIQSQIVVLEQQVNAALLQAARIVIQASQQHALATIQAVATVVLAILALVHSVSSKNAVEQMAARATVKLSAVQPFLNDDEAVAMVAAHLGEPASLARMQVAQVEQNEMQAGF